MKEMMVAVAMAVGLSANAQVMIGDINDTTVSITDTPSGCVILYFNFGEKVRQDTTETIPANYVHMTGSFPKVEEAPAKKSKLRQVSDWCTRNAEIWNGGSSSRYYSSPSNGVIYRHISPNATVTTTRYGNTFRTSVVYH